MVFLCLSGYMRVWANWLNAVDYTYFGTTIRAVLNERQVPMKITAYFSHSPSLVAGHKSKDHQTSPCALFFQ